MIEPAARKTKASLNVLGVEIRHFLKHLRYVQAGCQKIENIGDANAHPPYARPATALAGIRRDATKQRFGHISTIRRVA